MRLPNVAALSAGDLTRTDGAVALRARAQAILRPDAEHELSPMYRTDHADMMQFT